MKLTYRGITYDYPSQSSLDASEERTPYLLTYRGINFMVDPNSRTAETFLPDSYNLTYRGTTYHVVRNAHGVTAETVQAAQPSTPSAKAKLGSSVPSTMPRAYIGKVHKANLMQNVQRRLQVARERGDQELVRILEAELRQIAA